MNCDQCGAHACHQRLYTLNRAGRDIAHFDCLDCLTKWAANHSAPTEEIA